MTPKRRLKLQKTIGYSAFFTFALLLMLFATFPYEMVGEQVRQAAKAMDLDVSFGSIGPGFFSMKAKKVAVRKLGATGEALVIDSVSGRPTLFPPGLAFSVDAFGGSVDGSVGALGRRVPLDVKLKDVDLGKANLKPAFGLDLGGKLTGVVKLELDQADASKTTGRIALSGNGLVINGGTVANFDLPKVDLGRLDAEMLVEKGTATVKTFESKGADAESNIEGLVNLDPKLLMSTLQLQLKFKPGDDFLKRNSFIQTGLSFAMSKDPSGYYKARLERKLGNPRFVPMR